MGLCRLALRTLALGNSGERLKSPLDFVGKDSVQIRRSQWLVRDYTPKAGWNQPDVFVKRLGEGGSQTLVVGTSQLADVCSQN